MAVRTFLERVGSSCGSSWPTTTNPAGCFSDVRCARAAPSGCSQNCNARVLGLTGVITNEKGRNRWKLGSGQYLKTNLTLELSRTYTYFV